FENKKKKKIRKEPIYIGICILCLVIGTFGGYFYSSMTNKSQANESIDEYTQIKTIIEDAFVDTTDSQYSLKDRMLAGMVAGLGDRYTSFMTADQNKELQTSINGTFVGVGLSFTALNEGALVLEVYKGTPANKAKVQAGDIITHVQGTSIAGYDSDKVKNVIVGEAGTEVTLRVLRNGKSQEIKVSRENVDTSLSYEIRTSQQKKIGYIRLTTFGESTVELFEKALQEFQSQNVETLCIDLRENSGGYLDAAKGILNLLIPQGGTLYKEQQKDKDPVAIKAEKGNKYTFKNGYILANESSASASEVTAACLMDNLDYKLIGTKTFGKGLVQTQAVLKDSSILKYTNAKWLTPKGECIQGKGITPTYEVKQTLIEDFYYQALEKSYQYDQVSEDIAYMQEKLKELGYSVDRTDGYFSKATVNALKAFEKAYGLQVNGSYDKNDAIILMSALAHHIYQLEDKQYQKVLEQIK
ncbi:MAG: S41 family peptidase, partial [Coprobacillus sp.]